MKKILYFFIFFTTYFTYAQDSLNFLISGRVNLENPDKKEVFELYKNYFYSRPDSIYDNPFWNEVEKKQYYFYDFSSMSIFNGINDESLKQYFDFYVLSIEKYDIDKYTIRVLIQRKGGLQNDFVWCIHIVSAIKENNSWRLQNNFVKETANWKKYDYDAITYHTSSDYKINETVAKQANDFINEIIVLFDLNKNTHIDYFLAKDVDEIGRLQGFDYYYIGYTEDRIMNDYIFTTAGELQAHEFVHILTKTGHNRHFIVWEGLAEFLGTKKQFPEQYLNSINNLIENIFAYPEDYSPSNLLERKATYRIWFYEYPFGALLCEIIYEKKGMEGIRALIYSNTEENLLEVISDILEINKNEFDEVFLDFLNQGLKERRW
jgi:hypothetical protein